MKIADIRRDYKLKSLIENEVAEDAISQFTNWWNEALDSNIDEVNAMTLATASKEGLPSARIVLPIIIVTKEKTLQKTIMQHFFSSGKNLKGKSIFLEQSRRLVTKKMTNTFIVAQ